MAMPLPLGVLRQECPHEEDYELALRTLHTYISRLLDHPNVPKYKAISRHNASFHRRLGRYEAGRSCLEVIGYRLYDAMFRFEGRDTNLLTAARARIEAELANGPTAGGGPEPAPGGGAEGGGAAPSSGGASSEPPLDRVAKPLRLLPMDDELIAQHPTFIRMQARYLDDIAALGEKIRAIDENYDRKDALVREQAGTIALLQRELETSTNREEMLSLKEELTDLREENGRLLSHNQHLRGRLSLVQGDEFAEDDIEVADMSDWTRDQRETYVGKSKCSRSLCVFLWSLKEAAAQSSSASTRSRRSIPWSSWRWRSPRSARPSSTR